MPWPALNHQCDRRANCPLSGYPTESFKGPAIAMWSTSPQRCDRMTGHVFVSRSCGTSSSSRSVHFTTHKFSLTIAIYPLILNQTIAGIRTLPYQSFTDARVSFTTFKHRNIKAQPKKTAASPSGQGGLFSVMTARKVVLWVSFLQRSESAISQARLINSHRGGARHHVTRRYAASRLSNKSAPLRDKRRYNVGD